MSFAGRAPSLVSRACTIASGTLVGGPIAPGLMETVKSLVAPAFTGPGAGSLMAIGAITISMSWHTLVRFAGGSVTWSCALPFALKMSWPAG